MKQLLRWIGVPVTAAGLLVGATIAPAAATMDPIVIKVDGVRKAEARYYDSNNMFCVRVFNGTSGAMATLLIEDGEGGVVVAQDHGGDQLWDCEARLAPGMQENEHFDARLSWIGSGLDIKIKYGQGWF